MKISFAEAIKLLSKADIVRFQNKEVNIIQDGRLEYISIIWEEGEEECECLVEKNSNEMIEFEGNRMALVPTEFVGDDLSTRFIFLHLFKIVPMTE